MKFLREKSIVYTCDFFLTIKAYVSVIFSSSIVNMENIQY